MTSQDYFNPKLPFPTLPENLGGRVSSDFTPLQPVKASEIASSTESQIIADLRDEVIALQIKCELLTTSWVNRIIMTGLLCVISALAAAYITDELNSSWYNARLAQIKPCPTGAVNTGYNCKVPSWNDLPR